MELVDRFICLFWCKVLAKTHHWPLSIDFAPAVDTISFSLRRLNKHTLCIVAHFDETIIG